MCPTRVTYCCEAAVEEMSRDVPGHGTHDGRMCTWLIPWNMHCQMNMQIDESRRQYTIVAIEDYCSRRRFNRIARHLANDAVFDEYVPRQQARVHSVEDADVLDQVVVSVCRNRQASDSGKYQDVLHCFYLKGYAASTSDCTSGYSVSKGTERPSDCTMRQ